MKHKLIAILYFFLSFVVSFGLYAYMNKGESITIPVFACLGLSALVAIGVENYKTFFK